MTRPAAKKLAELYEGNDITPFFPGTVRYFTDENGVVLVEMDINFDELVDTAACFPMDLADRKVVEAFLGWWSIERAHNPRPLIKGSLSRSDATILCALLGEG